MPTTNMNNKQKEKEEIEREYLYNGLCMVFMVTMPLSHGKIARSKELWKL